MDKISQNIILHAPRIHSGGGLILLKKFIDDNKEFIRWANLDFRSKENLKFLPLSKKFIKTNPISLLISEYSLCKMAKKEDSIISFHGLPPLFTSRARVSVFCQNRLLFEPKLLKEFSIRARFRMKLERFFLKYLWHSSMEAWVQTPSMAECVKKFLGEKIKIKVVSFCSFKTIIQPQSKKIFDFIYVASGEPHKNHIRLLHAWIFLAHQGLKPSLALTLCKNQYPALIKKIESLIIKHQLNIINLGYIQDIFDIYEKTHALIFPSLTESLGLPLLEAKAIGLPIIASEKDFVRDSAYPIETFDPYSYISIANAVIRFINQKKIASLANQPKVQS